jgi:UDP-N-acetylmuramate dehydrogenase
MRPPDVTRAARTGVPLAGFTTLGLGGPAATLIEPSGEAGLVSAVRSADERGEPVLVLGGGSNVVVADKGFPGTVIRVATRGISFVPDGRPAPGAGVRAGGMPTAGPVAMTVAAGEDWDEVVARCTGEGLAGLECLSGIPGLAGATPIQNVGAYGQEVADTITMVRVYDRQHRGIVELPATSCGFGYRTSVFKQTAFAPGAPGTATGAPGTATGRFVVLAVTFRLSRGPLSAPIRYPELAAALGVAPGDRVALGEARSAVLKLRARKGMVIDSGDPDTRSAGSFFTNPVLLDGEFAAVEEAARARYGPQVRVPHFPAGDGRVKVPAAWLIEHAGFRKGHQGKAAPGGVAARISAKHTLALVNPGGATTADLLALAGEVRDGVREMFGVSLVIEPVLVGAAP